MVEKMKAKIAYTVREVTAPGETQPSTVPMIIDRSTTLPLAKLIANAIDRGLVAGLKPNAAEGIADGIAEQIYAEFSEGRGVAFGQFFYARPYLQGTVAPNGTLTNERNALVVAMYPGDDFKLEHSFVSEDTVVINTTRGQKSIKLIRDGVISNLFSALVPGSVFPQIYPGSNVFSYLLSGETPEDGAAFITFRYYDLYRGV